MDDELSKFLSAQRAFSNRVHAVREDQWSASTPCREWTVAELVSHLVEENRWAAPLLHGLDTESAGKVVEGSRKLPVHGGVGANLAEEWDEAAVEAADAVSADGALNRMVSLSRGPTPARQYIGEMIADLVIHGWDLGQAIGYDEPLPTEVVEVVYEMAKDMGDLSSTGMFDKPVVVPDDASTIDRLVALTGRDPRGGL
ncbi:MAG TPA: TIGR03086 family metal-binding protein [Jatrophihabitans sp.]|jgi:uncharacterized protein (TIGR03086 family)